MSCDSWTQTQPATVVQHRCNGDSFFPLQWHHNERHGVSNHRRHDCFLSRLFRCRSKKTSKPCVTGLCEGNSLVTGEFPAQRASNAENVSIWWHLMTSSCGQTIIATMARLWCGSHGVFFHVIQYSSFEDWFSRKLCFWRWNHPSNQ